MMDKFSHIFAATVLAGLGVMVNQNAMAGDNATLEQGNCAPTYKIQQAWNEENLNVVLGAEANMFLYDDNGDVRVDENGDPLVQEKEYIVAANEEGEWYGLMGNAPQGAQPTKYCVDLAGEGLKVPNNTQTPQSVPYENKIEQGVIDEELNGKPEIINSYLFAQGHSQSSNLTYTIFLTKQSDHEGKNFSVYAHKKNDTRPSIGGDSARIHKFGKQLSREYRQGEMQANLDQ